MSRIFKKLVISLIAVIIALYGLFPSYIVWLVSANLPSNINLISMDSGYPGLNSIEVAELIVTVDGKLIAINSLTARYDLSKIDIDSINLSIKTDDSEEQQQQVRQRNILEQVNALNLSANPIPKLSLPFEALSVLNLFSQIQVKKFKLITTNQQTIFSPLIFNRSDNSYTITVKNILINPTIATSTDNQASDDEVSMDVNLTLQFTLDKSNQLATLRVTRYDELLITAKYQELENSRKIIAAFNSDKLLAIIVDSQLNLSQLLKNLSARTRGDIDFVFLQDDKAQQLSVKINSVFQLDRSLIEKIKKTAPGLLLTVAAPLDEVINLPFEANIEIKNRLSKMFFNFSSFAKLNERLDLDLQQGLVFIDPAILKLELQAILSEEPNKKKKLSLIKAHSIMNSNELTWQAEKSQLNIQQSPEINLQGVEISTSITPFDFMFDESEAPLLQLKSTLVANKIDSIFLLTAEPVLISSNEELNNETVASEHNKIKVSGKLNINMTLEQHVEKLNNGQNIQPWITNGAIKIDELAVSKQNDSLDGIANIKWQDVESNTSIEKLDMGLIQLSVIAPIAQVAGVTLFDVDLQSDLKISKNSINGEIKSTINQKPFFPLVFNYDKKQQKLNLDFKKNAVDDELINQLLETFTDENISLKIVSGDIQHSAQANFKDELAIKSQLNIKNLLFQFGDNEIQGLNLTQTLSSVEPLKFQADITIEKVAFSSGFDITDIAAQLNSKTQQKAESTEDLLIELSKFSGNIFEGKLASDSIRLSGADLLPSEIYLKEISFTELIFFMNVEGLYAEGLLNLTLPMSYKKGLVDINNGHFEAIGEGLIKYSTGSEASDTDENIALQALRNFHYQSFNGTFSYNEKGQYKLTFHLQGANPDLYDGYPIDFDLTLNGELSGVFRSLFLTGNFEEAIMKQVKTDQLEEKEAQDQ